MVERADVLARLASLERKNAWVRRLGVGASVLFGLALLMGQGAAEKRQKDHAEVIKAEAFLLVDKDGAEVGKFAVVDGATTLMLRSKGSGGVVLSTRPDGTAAMAMDDANGKRRVFLGTDGGAQSGLVIMSGDLNANLAANSQTGSSILHFNETEGKPPRVMLTSKLRGGAGLFVQDERRTPRVIAGVADDGAKAFIEVDDAKGNTVWLKP